ncbi:MAG: hypothetical protein ACREFJ_16255, partial [Acetobacteraceae bacterium]
MAQRTDQGSAFLFAGFLVSLAAMGATWHFGVKELVPASNRFGLNQLLGYLWAGFSSQNLAPYAARAGRLLLAADYPWY